MNEQETKCKIMAGKYLNESFVAERDSNALDGSFEKLWDYCGLRDSGIDFFHQGPFSIEEKNEVFKSWLEILYKCTHDQYKGLEEKTISKRRSIRAEFLAKDPNGHVTLIPFIDHIVRMVDDHFGKYK